MLGNSGQAQIGAVVIGAITAALVVLIGVQIFSDINTTIAVNKSGAGLTTATPLMNLIPLLMSALVIIGIVGYFAFRG